MFEVWFARVVPSGAFGPLRVKSGPFCTAQAVSALGHWRTFALQQTMSALPPIATVKADIGQANSVATIRAPAAFSLALQILRRSEFYEYYTS
jgi:hypothetical protein